MTAAWPGVVACGGAPRDLGLDQGAAVAGAVRAARAELPLGARLGLRRGARGLAGRDALRFFPHLSERLAGLARGAGVSRRDLEALLALELDAGGAGGGAQAVALAPERTGAGALLARSLPHAGRGARWLLRSSAPEHDWRSVEIAIPWLAPALAGVNERGLAVAALVLAPSGADLEGCAAPALLLAQECLQRCDGVEKAIEWCERRPAGGRAALLLADASGDVAELAVAGAERRVRRARDGVLAAAGDAARSAELEKACVAAAAATPAELAALAAGSTQPNVVLDPAAAALLVDGIRYDAAPAPETGTGAASET